MTLHSVEERNDLERLKNGDDFVISSPLFWGTERLILQETLDYIGTADDLMNLKVLIRSKKDRLPMAEINKLIHDVNKVEIRHESGEIEVKSVNALSDKEVPHVVRFLNPELTLKYYLGHDSVLVKAWKKESERSLRNEPEYWHLFSQLLEAALGAFEVKRWNSLEQNSRESLSEIRTKHKYAVLISLYATLNSLREGIRSAASQAIEEVSNLVATVAAWELRDESMTWHAFKQITDEAVETGRAAAHHGVDVALSEAALYQASDAAEMAAAEASQEEALDAAELAAQYSLGRESAREHVSDTVYRAFQCDKLKTHCFLTGGDVSDLVDLSYRSAEFVMLLESLNHFGPLMQTSYDATMRKPLSEIVAEDNPNLFKVEMWRNFKENSFGDLGKEASLVLKPWLKVLDHRVNYQAKNPTGF